MSAMSRDWPVHTQGATTTLAYKAAATMQVYRGSLLWRDAATGRVRVSGQQAGDRIVGVSPHRQGIESAGDYVELYIGGLIWLPLGNTVTDASVGRLILGLGDAVNNPALALSDNPADLVCVTHATAVFGASDSVIGPLVSVTALEMLVALDPGGWLGRLSGD